MTTLMNYAHRGASGNYPENTMIAFERGIALGATGIETDVQMTKDGKLVLIHDEKLKRTTGVNALVADVQSEELLRLDADIDELIARRATGREIRAAASAKGFRSLAEDAVSRVVDLTDRVL